MLIEKYNWQLGVEARRHEQTAAVDALSLHLNTAAKNQTIATTMPR